MTKKLLLTLLPLLLITACGGNKDKEPPINYNEVTKTITFLNCGKTGTLSQDNKVSEFVTFFNNGDDLINTYEYEGYVQINTFNEFHTLCLGSGSSSGMLNFKFNYLVSKITLSFQNYYKYDSYHEVWNIDKQSQLIVGDNNTYDLTTTVIDQEPPAHIVDLMFTAENKIKNLKLENDAAQHRVFIHQMAITYLVPVEE